jgi:dolichol kinase
MTFQKEIYRKIFHLFLLIIPICYLKFGRTLFLTIFSLIALSVILIDYLRCNNDFVKKYALLVFKVVMRDSEIINNKMSGMSWVFASALLNFMIFSPPIAVTGFCILIFADAMAAVVGKSIKSRPFYQKSLAGSSAFFLSAILVILVCGIYFEFRLIFYFFAIFVASLLTYLEAYPSLLNIDDNFLIPIVFGVLMTLFDFMWHIL